MATFRFRGTVIPGTFLRHGKPPPEFQTMRTHFFGLHGVSEIKGGRGGRMLEFPCIIHNRFNTRRDLESYIDTNLNDQGLFGENGTIDYFASSTNRSTPYRNCTFHGFVMAPDGPLHDEAGTLDGGWFCYGVLLFYQLLVS